MSGFFIKADKIKGNRVPGTKFFPVLAQPCLIGVSNEVLNFKQPLGKYDSTHMQNFVLDGPWGGEPDKPMETRVNEYAPAPTTSIAHAYYTRTLSTVKESDRKAKQGVLKQVETTAKIVFSKDKLVLPQ